MHNDPIENLRKGERSVWLNQLPLRAGAFDQVAASRHVAKADSVWRRFAPVLAQLFETPAGSGRIESPLLEYPATLVPDTRLYVKADHALPISATVKARGGVFALLRVVETIAKENGILDDTDTYAALTESTARRIFVRHTVVVASTGNLGFSIGLVAIALGLNAEIHMSDCAKLWKKNRLRELGATVIEYPGDYSSTVAAARASVAARERVWFIDDENSWDLFLGYSGAGLELSAQLDAAGVGVSAERPLVVYLPCGVGGAPGGITYGLKAIHGEDVICVFVEPIAAACMLVAVASKGCPPPSVYEIGLSGRTEADGLAVSRASALVLKHVGREIDAIVAVSDDDLLDWVRRAWREAALKLEPSAAAGFAALTPLLAELAARPDAVVRPAWKNLDAATHVVWTTGGNQMPEEIFRRFL